jgi:hypothetical protein
MPVAVVPVKIAPTQPCVQLQVVGTPWAAAIRDAGSTQACENTVEFYVIHMETVIVAGELLALVKVQRQGLIDIHWRKVATLRFPWHGENVGQGLCGGNGIGNRRRRPSETTPVWSYFFLAFFFAAFFFGAAFLVAFLAAALVVLRAFFIKVSSLQFPHRFDEAPNGRDRLVEHRPFGRVQIDLDHPLHAAGSV